MTLHFMTLNSRTDEEQTSGLHQATGCHVGAVRDSYEIIPCHGMLLMPAATDMHVHMRGGNQAEKEDWHSGTMSAIAGG